MEKIEIKKSELVWKGKYDDDGRLKPVEKPGPWEGDLIMGAGNPGALGSLVERSTRFLLSLLHWKLETANQ